MSARIFPITMPKWGIEMTQGTITGWHAEPGQAVSKGDTLLDVETEKIVNSVEAPVSGTLRRILADVGATENVGALIAVFAATDVPDPPLEPVHASWRCDSRGSQVDEQVLGLAHREVPAVQQQRDPDDAPGEQPGVTQQLGVGQADGHAAS